MTGTLQAAVVVVLVGIGLFFLVVGTVGWVTGCLREKAGTHARRWHLDQRPEILVLYSVLIRQCPRRR